MGLPPRPLWIDSIPSSLILEENRTLFELYDYKKKHFLDLFWSVFTTVFCVLSFLSISRKSPFMNICFLYDVLFAIASAISSSPVPPSRALTPLTILTIVLPWYECLGGHQCAVVRDAWSIVLHYPPPATYQRDRPHIAVDGCLCDSPVPTTPPCRPRRCEGSSPHYPGTAPSGANSFHANHNTAATTGSPPLAPPLPEDSMVLLPPPPPLVLPPPPPLSPLACTRRPPRRR